MRLRSAYGKEGKQVRHRGSTGIGVLMIGMILYLALRSGFRAHYTVTPLGTLGGRSSAAYAINDRGQVVGQADNLEGHSHGCFWNHGRMIDLGTFGGLFSCAYAINNRGQ